MSKACRRLAFASDMTSETMSPPEGPFFLRAWGTSRFPTALHAHVPEAGP